MNTIPRATLLAAIPGSRYKFLSRVRRAPRIGDLLTTDQCFRGPDGLAMVMVYFADPKGKDVYQAEVYESELAPF